MPVEEGSDSTAVRHDFQLRLEDVLTSHLLPASSDEDKLGLVPQVHAYGQSKHGEDSDTSPQGNRNVNDIAVDDAAVDDLEETVTQVTSQPFGIHDHELRVGWENVTVDIRVGSLKSTDDITGPIFLSPSTDYGTCMRMFTANRETLLWRRS